MDKDLTLCMDPLTGKYFYADILEKKHKLIIETHNPYTADVYEYLLKKYADDYEIEERTRMFRSHTDEKDYRVYVRFKAMVTKEQEKAIREGIRREKTPMFRLYEKDYIQSKVRSAFKGVPFSSEVKEVKDESKSDAK